MKIIIINGTGASGKDLFVKMFNEKYEHFSENLSTIDEVKQIARKHFNWNGEKDNKSRKMLSDLKKIWTDYNNGPFQNIVDYINNNEISLNKNKGESIYFVHCREPEEIQKFIEYYKNDCKTLLIERDVDVPDNYSDKSVYNFIYDYVIDNNSGIDDLNNKVIDFIEKIKT